MVCISVQIHCSCFLIPRLGRSHIALLNTFMNEKTAFTEVCDEPVDHSLRPALRHSNKIKIRLFTYLFYFNISNQSCALKTSYYSNLNIFWILTFKEFPAGLKYRI